MADATDGLSPNLSSYNGYAASNALLAKAGNDPTNASQWLGVAQQQTQLSQQQFDLATKHLSALNGLAASVMADPSPDNATQRISDGIQMGVIAPQDGNRELANLTALGGDPAKIKQWAFQHWSTIASQQQQLATAYGQTGTIDNGQTITPVVSREGPQAGIYAAGGNAMQKFMAPGEASAPADYTDPATGRTIQTTLRGRNQAVGDPAGLPPAQGALAPAPQPGAGYSGVNSPNSYVDPRRAATAGVRIVNGVPVYGPLPAAAPASAVPSAGPPPAPGAVVGSAPVGSTYGSNSRGPTVAGAGLSQPGPQSGAPQPAVPGLAGPSPMLPSGRQAYVDDLQNSSAKMQGVQPLLNALPLIQQLGATGSGPGTKAFNDAKSALVSAGIIPAGLTDVDVRDEANKYLNQYVARSGIAQRSDMGTLVSQQSSPNLDTSNAATQSLTRNAIAQDRMDAARPLAYGGGDNLAGYGQFKAGWTQSQDPRAYQLDVMPADQRTALLSSMAAKRNTPEGRKFFSSLQNAMTAKVVTPPSAPGPATGGAGGQ